MLAKLSRIRVSSVTRILAARVSTGTLKSTRINTRLPRTSRSRNESFAIIIRAPARARNRARQNSLPLLRAKHQRAERICGVVRRAFAQFWTVVLCPEQLDRRLQAFAQAERPNTLRTQVRIRVPFRKIGLDP